MARMYFMMPGALEDEYDTKIKTRQANLGTDLSTLETLFDSGKF